MARISNTDKYAFDTLVRLTDYVIGTDSDTSNKTKNFSVLNLYRSFQEFSGITYMTLSDIESPDYDYYGGCFMKDEWVVFRYLKIDINDKTQATEGFNMNVKSLEDAWSKRETLIYN